MRRGIVQYVALLTLLVQGALGSVAPIAVLCMHHGSCESAILAEVSSKNCSVHGCCQSHSQVETSTTRPVIAIAFPCEGDCQNCVDVGLPDLDLASADRVSVQAEDLSSNSMPLAIVVVHGAATVPQSLQLATGPPDRLACLHAPIIRSTRLLI